MKNICLYFTICACVTINYSAAQTGYLDTTFNGDGKLVYSTSSNSDAATSVAIQKDGKILAVGTNDTYFRLARFYPDGSLDSAFAQWMLSMVTSGTSYACALQPDSEIVVVGTAYNTIDQTYNFYINRYQNSGVFSFTFNGTGNLSVDFEGGTDIAYSVALQSDGKIVVAGSSVVMDTAQQSHQRFAVVRIDSTGKADSTFSGDGKQVTYVTPTNSVANSVVIQTDGKIILAGQAQTGTFTWNTSLALVRYNTDGSLDSSFGTGGIVLTDFDSSTVKANAVVLQPDNKILIAGNIGASSSWCLVARYNTDGTLDTSFNGGHSIGLPGTAKGLALQTDGKIVTAGWSFDTHSIFCAMRWNTNGTTDNTFGTNGILKTDIGPDEDKANAVAIQPDGKIIAAGYTRIPLAYNDFALVRYLPSLNVGIINFSSQRNLLMVYPNPVQANNTLEYTLISEETISIKLFNIQGIAITTFVENLKQQPGMYKQSLVIPGSLPSGEYIVTISSANGIRSVRIIK